MDNGKLLHGAKTLTADSFKIEKSDVTKWMKKSLVLIEEVKAGAGSKTRVNGYIGPEYKEQEEMLFDAVYIRRQLLGLWIDRYWLQDEFKEILDITKPPGYENFLFSNGWVSNFCRRWNISQQARSNKKDVPIAVKEGKLKFFHRSVYALQNSARHDLIYGRFSPLRMFHADQSPCELAMPGNRTLNIRDTPCWMWMPAVGWTKGSFLSCFAYEQRANKFQNPLSSFVDRALTCNRKKSNS